MDFFLTSDTAGSHVGKLTSELRHILCSEVEKEYSNINMSIGIVIRCLPDSYNRKSFTRYCKNKNDLTIDICVSLEDYEKMYKIEQRFELGKIFLKWLNKGLSNKNFIANNPNFDARKFENLIVNLGNEYDWFISAVDYSRDLDT